MGYKGDSGFRIEAHIDSIVSLVDRKIYITRDGGVVPIVGEIKGLKCCDIQLIIDIDGGISNDNRVRV